MFEIDTDKTIHITRGDVASIEFQALDVDGNIYTFTTGDVVRFNVFEKKNHNNVVLQKDFTVNGATTVIDVLLYSEDTTIGDIIDKPVDYWYEVEVNPETAPQTVIGYDEDGPKVFRLYPEGSVIHD